MNLLPAPGTMCSRFFAIPSSVMRQASASGSTPAPDATPVDGCEAATPTDLDTLPATIDALPEVVAAVEGRLPLLVDGGIRRGTDVVKALARGADAVLIGRPYLWGLAAYGAAGGEKAVRLLVRETELALALCGRRRAGEVGAEVLWDS